MDPINTDGKQQKCGANGARSTHLTEICAKCQFMFENWPNQTSESDFVFPHYTDPFQLEASAKDGCSLCTQFLRGPYHRDFRRLRESLKRIPLEEISSPGVRIWKRESDHRSSPFPRLSLYLAFYIPKTHDEDYEPEEDGVNVLGADAYVHLIPTFDTPRTPTTFNVANTYDAMFIVRHWLEDCRESHESCYSRPSFFTPSRLVSTEETGPRLFLAESFLEPPSYATLSHCWGVRKSSTLESHNLDTFRKQIPSEALPRTIRDSIRVARELGFPFIWIDTLCILQDDTNDWLKEADTMSDVYSSAGLNIAATSAQDPSWRCFYEKEPAWRCRVRLKTVYQTVSYDCVPFDMYSSALTEMPLLNRGWVLQERLLATRTVHFSSREIYWECYGNVACETFPSGFPRSLRHSVYFLHKKPITRGMWKWIVDDYSNMALTYAKDKLIAISGLARQIQNVTMTDNYVAGMWSKDLEHQLCWSTAINQRAVRIDPYRAPTWSWASLDGLIDFRERTERFSLWIKILDIQMQPADPAIPFGALASGTICIYCSCLAHTRLSISNPDSLPRKDFLIVAGRLVRIHLMLDCYDYSVTEDMALANNHQSAVVLPVLDEGSSDGHSRILGLILEPIEYGRGRYCRIGMFWTDDESAADIFETGSTDSLNKMGDQEVIEMWTTDTGMVHTKIEIV